MFSTTTYRATLNGRTVTVAVYKTSDGDWCATAQGCRWFGRGNTEAEAIEAFCHIGNSAYDHARERGLTWEIPSGD